MRVPGVLFPQQRKSHGRCRCCQCGANGCRILRRNTCPLSAIDLGATVIREALLRADLTPGNVSEGDYGQVLTGGSGQNPARQSSLRAGIPQEIPAWTLNIVCGSGLRSVIQGVLAIQSGMSTIVVAGGQESMSNAPHCAWLRSGIKMGSTELVDTMDS